MKKKLSSIDIVAKAFFPPERKIWKIKSLTEKENRRYLYWNNELGWTRKKFADIFTEEERKTLNLPTWSIWEKQREKQ